MGVYQGDKPLSRYGKSAYQQAVEGGYTGTQEEFNALLASVGNKQDKITGTSGQVAGFDADGNLVAQEAPSGVTDEEKAAWNAKADAPFKPSGKSYLTFSSPSSFTLAVNDATKHWDGTLEYFASDKTWTVWDGTTTLSSVENDGEYVLYLRGTGNTKITGSSYNDRWVLTGSDIACVGNIENLLDYTTVKSGAHPTMVNNCYRYMFRDCTSLTQAPALPATTLADHCYASMFYGCTGLTQASTLPATTLADYCYSDMFRGCTGLTQAPALPATTLAGNCYDSMFYGCTSLTQAPALPATTLAGSCYYRMFYKCASLKLSATQTGEYTQEYRIPSSGSGTTATDALSNMFASTGGTFTGTPEINTTYYLSSDNMVVRETEIATLNGYVGSMIDAVTPESIGAAPSSHTSDTTVHITAAERTAWNAKLDSFTETDPTVPAWAKASSKPTYTASEVSAVPISGTTMKGALVAQNNTNLTTKQVRNITISTTEPTSSDGAVGDIWIVYEA